MKRSIPYLLALVLAIVLVAHAQQGTITSEISKCTTDGHVPSWSSAAGKFNCAAPEGGGGGDPVPSGAILIIKSGTCPTGYTEDSDLNGKTLFGTVAANGDVGTAAGADNITPAGSAAFTGTSSTVVINHTHGVNITDPGHTHVETNNSATAGGNVGWGAQDTSTNTQSVTGYSTQSSTTGITATTNNPAGGAANYTPAGSVSFTGTEFDNRSAFRRVIFCRKD
jgi:hypothetical protein